MACPPASIETSPYLGFNAASSDGAAVAPVSDSPSWNVTFGRNENRQRLKSGSCCQATASTGSIFAARVDAHQRLGDRNRKSGVDAIRIQLVQALDSSTVKVPP